MSKPIAPRPPGAPAPQAPGAPQPPVDPKVAQAQQAQLAKAQMAQAKFAQEQQKQLAKAQAAQLKFAQQQQAQLARAQLAQSRFSGKGATNPFQPPPGGFPQFRNAKAQAYANRAHQLASNLPPGTLRPVWDGGHTVNQLHPEGADGNYKNGAFNCAGAVAATVARKLGTWAGVSDADLVTHLSNGRTSAQGTKPEDMMAMLEDAGARPDGKPIVGHFNPKHVNDLLDSGHKIVAEIGLENVDGSKHHKGKYNANDYSSHYVLIDGKDAKGNYKISDPLKGDYTVSPQQLQDALWRAPKQGMLIPISPAVPRPSESAATQALMPNGPLSHKPFAASNAHLAGVKTNFEAYGHDKYAAMPRLSAAWAQTNASLFGKGPRGPTDPHAKRKCPVNKTPDAVAASLVTLMADKNHPTRALAAERQAKEYENSKNPADQAVWEAFMRFVDELNPGGGIRVWGSGSSAGTLG